MPWLKKKPDPISDRARTLNAEIAALESQIKKLDSKLHRDQTQVRVRSTALPRGDHSVAPATTATAPPTPPSAAAREPIFEDLELRNLKSPGEAPSTPHHFNDLGVRKYDVTTLVARLKHLFSGPTTMNPRLVSYLAAGGIQGLQPLRREKRVARNRLIAMAAFLGLVLTGVIYIITRSR